MIFGSSSLSQLSPEDIVPLSPPLLSRSGTTHWKSDGSDLFRLGSRSEKLLRCEHCSLKSLK